MDANEQNLQGAKKCVNCQTVEKLDSENRRLRKEQDVLFLLMDLGMTAVELWGEQHGLFSGKKIWTRILPMGTIKSVCFLTRSEKREKKPGWTGSLLSSSFSKV